MPEQINLVKIKQVVGFYYRNEGKARGVVLYAKGGPSLGDDGNSSAWQIARKFKYDLFVPDYIGYCRSEGEFNFKTNIGTLYESEDFLRGKLTATDSESFKTIKAAYKNIILIGSSWGGSMVPFLEKYRHSDIKVIGLIKPVTDWRTQGRTKAKEEKVEATDKMINLVWSHLYRGYAKSEWPQIFNNKNVNEFNPLDQTQYLKGKQVLIAHGTIDDVVNYKKSVKYFEKLKAEKIAAKLKLYKVDHGSQATKKGFAFILKEYSKSR